MKGHSLKPVIEDDRPVRDAAIFGVFSGHVNLVDQEHIYMRAAVPERADDIFNYTVLPLHMFAPFREEELRKMTFAPPFSFTRGCGLLKIPSKDLYHVAGFGNLLFDKIHDPKQQNPIADQEQEEYLCRKLVAKMQEFDAPREQYYRLGLEAYLPENCAEASQIF